MKKYIAIIALFPLFILAEGGVLVVGEETVTYDTSTATENTTLYYLGETLVASKHETLTLVYKDELPVLEAHDTDGDGTPDTFFRLDSSESVVEVQGKDTDAFVRSEVVEFPALLAQESDAGSDEEDLVGDLDSITIPHYRNYTLYVLVVLLLSGGYFWYRRKRKQAP